MTGKDSMREELKKQREIDLRKTYTESIKKYQRLYARLRDVQIELSLARSENNSLKEQLKGQTDLNTKLILELSEVPEIE